MMNEEQAIRERKSLEDGRLRFLKRQERVAEDQGQSEREANLKMTRDCLPLLTQAFERAVPELNNKGAGRTPVAFSYLQHLEADLIARVTLSALFNSISKADHLQNTLVHLGRLLESELWSKALSAYDTSLHNRLVTRVNRVHGNTKYRQKAIRATAAKQGFKEEPWTDDLRVTVAGPCLNVALAELSDIFQLTTVHKGRKTLRAVKLTDAAFEELMATEELLSWMQPVFTPMVVPPRPWESFTTGCYHTPELACRVPLIRSRDRARRKLTEEAIADGLMSPCLEALNAIQATPWAINERVLEVVLWAWDQQLTDISKFPRNSHLSLPERPENYEELKATEQKAWRIRRSEIIERNRGIDAERITVIQDLRTARELLDHEAFWVPHNLDFRGRVYPVCHFNQQRTDYVKALMEFAEGKPLGEHGAYWLAVHLANCGDFDKISKRSLDERVQWVEDNVAMIESIAADPYTNTQWMQADKPFQFLAACVDFEGYLRHGSAHVSHLPIALDGSNSGLQHYSAALRSTEGALVNLVPSERPADIYQSVADLVSKAVKADADKGDTLAGKVIAQGITRSLVKRNVMTFAYSSGQFGFKQQLLSDVMGPLALKVMAGELEEHPYAIDGDGGYLAAGYLAKQSWQAVNSLVHKASEGMRWFQSVAQGLAHEAKPLIWYTPVGLPVMHRYDEFDYKRVKLFLHDRSVTLDKKTTEDRIDSEGRLLKNVKLEVRTKPKGTIDKRKARNAVAPNIIHSLDAAHLMLAVLDATDCGITSFSMIHDSFATHASDTPVFFQVIREAFVNMYEQYDPFEAIRTEALEAIDDKARIQPVPEKGTLDLHGVIDSLYAFA